MLRGLPYVHARDGRKGIWIWLVVVGIDKQRFKWSVR